METYVLAALALVAAGVAIGIIVTISLGIKRNDRPGGFLADTEEWTARAACRVTGIGTRSTALRDEAGRHQDVLLV